MTRLDAPEAVARWRKAHLFGHAKRYGNRMSVRFDRIRLKSGEEFPVCALAYDFWGQTPGLERFGPGSHQGVGVGNTDPEILAWVEALGPGDFPVAGPTRAAFGALLRPEYVTLR